jgi:hypothetical protein
VLGVHGGSGLAVAGEVLPRLPGSMQRVWSAAASKSAVPLGLAIAEVHAEELPWPLDGAVRIDLEVERGEPMAADGGAEEGAETAPGDGGTAGEEGSDGAQDAAPVAATAGSGETS